MNQHLDQHLHSQHHLHAKHRPHSIGIRPGTPKNAEFFFLMDEQTTWESLPADKALAMRREDLRASLMETHGLLLSCPGNIFFIAENIESEAQSEHADERERARSGERAGLLWLGPRHNLVTGEHEAWIYNVTVVPQCRGCGVAKKLMAHAENYARENGYQVIGLSVAVHNEIARGLYQRMEYAESNILMRKPLQTPV